MYGGATMSRHAHMSQAAMTNRIERDQTSLEDVRSVAEKIAFSFEVAVAELPKLEGYPATQARVGRRVRELGNQLMLLADYADEYAATFHIEEPPHSMRVYNASADLLQGIACRLGDEIFIDLEGRIVYTPSGTQTALAYGDADLSKLDADRAALDAFQAEVAQTRRMDEPR
jgi:hypothetical protein